MHDQLLVVELSSKNLDVLMMSERWLRKIIYGVQISIILTTGVNSVLTVLIQG